MVYTFEFNRWHFKDWTDSGEYNVLLLRSLEMKLRADLKRNKFPILVKDVLLQLCCERPFGSSDLYDGYTLGWDDPEDIWFSINQTDGNAVSVGLANLKRMFYITSPLNF